MRFAAILNRDGETLRTLDLDAFAGRIRETLEAAGHSVEIDVVAGRDIAAALEKAIAKRNVDVVLAGGGDGTISTAASLLMNKKKALAVLPAGTMNLFARGLGIPQTLEEALQSFADGEVMTVDMASANGRPFVHQFSVGMHARMVQLRRTMDFGSRFGKMQASVRAAWAAIKSPPALKVSLAIGISNNLFGEGHLPYADNPSGGVLGIYVSVARRRHHLAKLLLDILRGRLRQSAHVEVHESDKVVLKIHSRTRKFSAVLDGELVKLERETTIEIHPGALKVLVPSSSAQAKAA
ncbi:MAG: diacylglycerol kinase family lipid kinase [Alphaproteobacteria bacterium]|nr:diacylglycerol kinase family lipid kinase [Alphaproteobacteria bacterium]